MLVFQKQRTIWRTALSLANTDNAKWRNAHVFVDATQLPTMTEARERRANTWKRSPTDWIKCNYDGSYKASTNTANEGWLFKDVEGVFRGAGSVGMDPTYTSLEGEFKVFIIAMQSAWSKGFTKVIFEVDGISVCSGFLLQEKRSTLESMTIYVKSGTGMQGFNKLNINGLGYKSE